MKKGRDYWSRHIAAWRQSGQSRKAYCEEHGLSYWSMRNWISKLPEVAAPESQRLVELEPIGVGVGVVQEQAVRAQHRAAQRRRAPAAAAV